jgi:hypothetical protein
MAVKLGNKVRDTITGFTGIAVGRTEWLYGCTRIGVEPTELKDGKLVVAQWLDEQRLVVVEPTAPVVSPDSSARTGGPMRDPAQPKGG